MEKRLPLFLFLSLLILLAYNVCNPPRPAVEPPAGGESVDPGAAVGAEAGPEPEPFEAELAASEEVTETLMLGTDGEPGHWRLVVSNRGARIESMAVGGFYRRIGATDEEKRDPDNWAPLLEPVIASGGTTGSLLLATRPSSQDLAPQGLDDVLWTQEVLRDEDGAARGVEWRYGPGAGLTVVKRLEREPGTWNLHFELELINAGEIPARQAEFLLTPAGCVPPELEDKFYEEPRAIAVGYDAEDEEYVDEWESAHSASDEQDTLDVPLPLVLAGVHNKYFAFLLHGADDPGRRSLVGASYAGVRDLDYVDRTGDEGGADRFVSCDIHLRLNVPGPGETSTYGYQIYAGPKDPDLLADEGPAFVVVGKSDLSGWTIFSAIGSFLLVVLRFFHGLVGNWGVAIILLTVCVRTVLFPLNRRSQTAMARYQTKMKRVQPRLEEIKKKHEKNPQKLREEQARIMQEEGAFPPLGGCLPIFLQIPIFFGLFGALRTAFDLRQAPFVSWIDDLSRPDRLLQINLPVPLIGEIEYLNLLPILMVVLWIVQQMGMPKPTDEQALRMQKMMMVMPVLMGVFLYNYAAGLSVYMITQSALGIVEQRVIKKLWPIDDAEPDKKPARGCGPFSGMMENLAEKHREQLKQMQAAQRSGAAAKPGSEARRAEKKRKRRL